MRFACCDVLTGRMSAWPRAVLAGESDVDPEVDVVLERAP